MTDAKMEEPAKVEEPKKVEKKKARGQPSASEEGASPYPDMSLHRKIHQLTVRADIVDLEELQKAVAETVSQEIENPSLFKSIQGVLGASSTALSPGDLIKLEEKHAEHLKTLEAKVEEAKENAGDMEVMDARVQIARFAAKSLSKEETLDAYKQLLALPKVSSGKKIDALMESARVAAFYGDTVKTDEFIESAQKIATEGGGGDWDRRNRLKVYRALSKLLSRDIKGASGLLIDCIATFSCNEMCSYDEFIVYAVLTNLLHLPRPQLKEKLLDGPEILSVASDIPIILKLVNAFYECDYKAYLHSMVELEPVLRADPYFKLHSSYWMRELHILAYKQFLDSYQSVTLQAMADAFGVSAEFIDHFASQFIAAGRLTAKIDKFGGTILTNRPDLKNAQYREMIQKGDVLLNRVQKLARVVDL